MVLLSSKPIFQPPFDSSFYDLVPGVVFFPRAAHDVERVPKAFTGFIRCGECGGMITAEIQKGHTYYRCTKKSKVVKCSQPFVREEELERQLSALLAQFTLRQDWAEGMLAMLENDRKDISGASRAFVAEKQAEIGQIAVKQQRLLEAYLEQLIDRQMFASQKAELLAMKKHLQEQIESCEDTSHGWLEPMKNWIQTAQNTGKIAVSGSPQEKKALAAQVFGSNLFLDCKKARVSGVNPWFHLTEKSLRGGMVRVLGFADHVGRYFSSLASQAPLDTEKSFES